MVYQCSCCKTGSMNTKEQYLTHVNSTKHKKKAFSVQAPHAGIEYEEFRPKTQKKPDTFLTTTKDFPQLSENIPVVSTPKVIQYVNILESFPAPNLMQKEEVNGHCQFDEVEEDDTPTSLDDIFFKDISRIGSAKQTLDSYAKNNKTASAALNEVAVAMGWKLDFEPVRASDNNFGFMVTIDTVGVVQGEGESKKEAKQNASTEAIKIIRKKLREEKNKLNQIESGSKNQNTFAVSNQNVSDASNQRNKYIGPKKDELPADAYCRLTIEKLMELEGLSNNKFVIPRRYAAFIITERYDQLAKDGVVVAFGAGDGVLRKSQEIQDHPGFHITNFDSLVLARRSFQCFLYNQLTPLFNKDLPKNKLEKIYFSIDKSGNVKLKEGCRIHLFMSHAPHGDCVESIPSIWCDPKQHTNKEIERDKNGIVEPVMMMTYGNNSFVREPGHIRVLQDEKGSGWISLMEYRARMKTAPDYMVMSPTDKLMAWIHLGIEGALLSHVMTPVHLYSVQVANDYMHEHFSRALLCRVPIEKLEDIVDMSKFKDPFIARVSKLPDPVQPLMGLSKQRVSYNWYSNPVTRMPEIIDNETGLVHKDSPYKLPDGDPTYQCSRLSKVCMLLRLKNLFKYAVDYYALRPELQRARTFQGIGEAAQYRYLLYKNSAVKYRSLKQCLFRALDDRCYGDWAPNNKANDFDLLQYYDL